MKDVMLLILSFGMYAKPFDKKAYAESNFNLRDIAYCETDPVANQLRGIQIRLAVDNAEATYFFRIANRRAIIVAWISVIATIVSMIVSILTR
jgi:hypothetical protein